MATYPYTGILSDFAEAPFPGAYPELYVRPEGSAMVGQRLLAEKRIPVAVGSNGAFTVDLVPSTETVPMTKYWLHCDWFADGGSEPLGYSEWEFFAQVGGGPIDPGERPQATVWVGPPWPPGSPKGIYFDRFTNDVGVRN